ncbi:hypothetical protein CHS0354_028543 [Potamilus streckersoni]|uniref:Uncharacterized protein n=1 Tax=Potamilus streckersoni TaxID=2493646 RepID=A0AAE0TIH9_9BIVA|nr:hypothetical protein CHS0354_028543 [Potamilus streckersoni]
MVIYILLCLILLLFRGIQTQDETNYAEYDSYASVNNAIRNIFKNRITAGNTKCRADHHCGRHGEDYSWCYTDYSWEYCCEGPCIKAGREEVPTMTCHAGSLDAYCGSSGDTAADGTTCHPSHPCGTHGGSRFGYFWCYDQHKRVKHCCNPHDECSKKGYNNHWCKTTIHTGDSWAHCTPKEQK